MPSFISMLETVLFGIMICLVVIFLPNLVLDYLSTGHADPHFTIDTLETDKADSAVRALPSPITDDLLSQLNLVNDPSRHGKVTVSRTTSSSPLDVTVDIVRAAKNTLFFTFSTGDVKELEDNIRNNYEVMLRIFEEKSQLKVESLLHEVTYQIGSSWRTLELIWVEYQRELLLSDGTTFIRSDFKAFNSGLRTWDNYKAAEIHKDAYNWCSCMNNTMANYLKVDKRPQFCYTKTKLSVLSQAFLESRMITCDETALQQLTKLPWIKEIDVESHEPTSAILGTTAIGLFTNGIKLICL